MTRPALAMFLLSIALPAAVDAQSVQPCMGDDAHRVFDFWIGSWEVTTPDGRTAGTNRIERILGGCALLENWTGTGGSAGKSVNYFDPEHAEWRQLWVDAAGGHMDYRGRFTDGSMRFDGTNVRPDGTTSLMRMTFTPLEDGRVRQFIEESTDGGDSWATWFEGYYARIAQ